MYKRYFDLLFRYQSIVKHRLHLWSISHAYFYDIRADKEYRSRYSQRVLSVATNILIYVQQTIKVYIHSTGIWDEVEL